MSVWTIILTTLIPGLELRASIPLGIGLGMNPWFVFALAILVNIALAVIVWVFLQNLINFVCRLNFINHYWSLYIKKIESKMGSAIHKYGPWALAFFIAIPLPLSGVYSGMIAAHIFDLKLEEIFVPTVLGVTMAGLLVLGLSMLGFSAFAA